MNVKSTDSTFTTSSNPCKLADRPASTAKVDIHSLLERPTSTSSPGNASTTSRTSNSSVTKDRTVSSRLPPNVITAHTPSSLPGPPLDVPAQTQQHGYQPMRAEPYGPARYGPPPPQYTHPGLPGYPAFPPSNMGDPRLPPQVAMKHVPGPSNKRLAPPQPHPAESPAKKKQSKWTVEEDASIIELRGNGMKWEDISKYLPGRSAISCRLRFQNYLERRSEWDEEKKNKLARLYERFKKDMWEKISKEMALPWRAAEAMHWQIGEVEMAQRANVPVFHLAGQQCMGSISEGRASSTSPLSATGPPLTVPYSHTHNHGLPPIAQSLSQPVSPMQTRLRRNSNGSSPTGPSQLRRRADSARSVPSASSTRRVPLPLAGELAGPLVQAKYKIPPAVMTAQGERR